MAATDDTTPAEPQLFSLDPIKLIKVITVNNTDGSEHVFILNGTAAEKFCGAIRDLAAVELTEASTSGTSLSDDGPNVATISNMPEFVFREIDMQTMSVIVPFWFWKERYCNVVTERIPDFSLPSDKSLALKVLVATNDLRS